MSRPGQIILVIIRIHLAGEADLLERVNASGGGRLAFGFARAGRSIPAKMAMIATLSNSISVEAHRFNYRDEQNWPYVCGLRRGFVPNSGTRAWMFNCRRDSAAGFYPPRGCGLAG